MDLEFDPSKHRKGRTRVDLALDSPFDLDAYAAAYQGRKKVERLMFVGESCPALAADAYALAATTIMSSTLDTKMYAEAVDGYNNAVAQTQGQGGMTVKGKQRMAPDQRWVEETKRTADATSDRLEVELKNYQTNLIKESIRMGHRELGRHYHRMGDLNAAIRSHTKSRDFCTSTAHVVDLCLSVIDVALEAGNYSFVRSYVSKAEAAVESMVPGREEKEAKKAAAVHMPGVVQGPSGLDPKEKERLRTQERVEMASGVAYLGQGAYHKAAGALLRVSREAGQAPGFEPVISPADVALYTTLCALATFDRAELKRRVIDNAELRSMLELEPQLKDVLSAFRESRYKQALEILDRYSPRHLLDIHLAPHVRPLLDQIRNRALVQYFSPFSTVSLARMSSAFGFSPARLDASIKKLIESGELKARLDGEAGVLQSHDPDPRARLFAGAVEAQAEMARMNRLALLRLKLVQNDVLVKESGRAGGGGGGGGLKGKKHDEA